jgi:hypothetical protein
VNQRRAEQRYRASRRRLRARALIRLDGLAAELEGSQLRAATLVAFVAAPWPSLLLLAPDLGATPAAVLAVLTTVGSATFGMRVAERSEGEAVRR